MAIDWDEVIRENRTIQEWVEKFSKRAVEEIKRTNAIAYLRDMIELFFGVSPQGADEKIEAVSIDQINIWFKRAVVVTDINDFFA